MKRYKLLKNLPTFNAGDVFYLNEAGSLIHENDGVVAYTWTTIDKFPNILTDWFEEIKESTRWKPDFNQKYYYLDSDGPVYNDIWDDDFSVDNGRFDIGNCFKTEEEAERVAKYLKAIAVVRGDATTKFTKGNSNWFVYFSLNDNSLDSDYDVHANINGVFGLPYFATQDDAQRSINQHKKEWLTIFGVKEEL